MVIVFAYVDIANSIQLYQTILSWDERLDEMYSKNIEEALKTYNIENNIKTY